MTDFTELVDLAAERVGGAVLIANDDFFAPKENLIKAARPVFLEHEYTERGKWMDGWESRRRRTPGHDWCILKLGLPGRIRGVTVDTSFFRGNFPEACSIDAIAADSDPDAAELVAEGTAWTEVLPQVRLQGDSANVFPIESDQRWTHLRLHIYPDGGVARLRVHGDVLPDWGRLTRFAGLVDLAAVENGGVVLACNDMFFGSRHNLIMPGRAVNMGDGWETKRSRRQGSDWVIVKLGARGAIRRVEIDTNHFKGNFPESCLLEGCDAPGASVDALREGAVGGAIAGAARGWKEILPRTKLRAHYRHFYDDLDPGAGAITHARLHIFPDGGVSRLRLHGQVDPGVAGGGAR